VTAVRFGEVVLLAHGEVGDMRQQTTAALGEDDLDILREEFSNVLNERKTELDKTMREALQNDDMPEEEKASQIEQWMGSVDPVRTPCESRVHPMRIPCASRANLE
jgi:hypothetical protein